MSDKMKDWMRDNLAETGDSYNSDCRQMCCCLSNYGKIGQMDIYEMADFLDSISEYEGTPWAKWFQESFCDKCKVIEKDGEKFSRCELGYEDSLCACKGLCNKPTAEIILAWLNPNYYYNNPKN